MAVNPSPTHISDEMWWFIEELERLEPEDTQFAGAWGDFKPGYHADAWTLWFHKVGTTFPWRNDYSIALPDDKVLGNPDLEHLGAAVDWTFTSAQNGDHRIIRKYGGRVRAAFLARDPRLHGWREVLIQADADASADGYDFVGWFERTPDITHDWHGHFSRLRKYLRDRRGYEAMISILRGDTLAQWEARSMAKIVQTNDSEFGQGALWGTGGSGRMRLATEKDWSDYAIAWGIPKTPTWSGTEANATRLFGQRLDKLQGPKGDKGDKGDPGVPGTPARPHHHDGGSTGPVIED